MLSLWRGEMCTASFRMPLEDVGRLLDTLDDGYAEAGGDELVQSGQHAPQAQPADYPEETAETAGDFPATGHYARPPQQDYPAAGHYQEAAQGHDDYPAGQYADTGARDDYYPDPMAARDDYQGDYQGYDPARGHDGYQADYQGHYADDPAPEAQRAAGGLGPNDVLVVRGGPVADKLVAGQRAADPIPRENLLDDQYGRSSRPDLDYPAPDPYADPYAAPPAGSRGRQGGGSDTDPYGFSAREVDEHGSQYTVPAQQGTDYADYNYGSLEQDAGYGRQVPHPDPYGTPAYDAGHPQVDRADPLGLGPGAAGDEYYQNRPYSDDIIPYATGERLRPEQGRDDRDDRRDW
ncbi:hypothetical protein [Microtetraspora sp. NBRC 13810]|uniref:hypothetical protein n=1 Tax=Microtetraspora sp. NBRC 13810 TaxID=3030990 RepID=UPI00255355D7|nr:hypothetical protein [Microtetraspora sp. NBRC 13810]